VRSSASAAEVVSSMRVTGTEMETASSKPITRRDAARKAAFPTTYGLRIIPSRIIVARATQALGQHSTVIPVRCQYSDSLTHVDVAAVHAYLMRDPLDVGAIVVEVSPPALARGSVDLYIAVAPAVKWVVHVAGVNTAMTRPNSIVPTIVLGPNNHVGQVVATVVAIVTHHWSDKGLLG
jgi:hypothetical protein